MSGWIRVALLGSFVAALVGCADRGIVREGGKITLEQRNSSAAGFTISRATLDEALARGPSWLIQQVTVRPVLFDRRFYGFQVVSLFPDRPALQDLPLKIGDIIQQANGISIERPDQFMKAWESLAGADHLSIRVVRDGRPLMITWMIERSDHEGYGSTAPSVSFR